MTTVWTVLVGALQFNFYYDELNWSDHADSLYEEVHKNINIFRMIRIFVNKKTTLISISISYSVISILVYMYFNFSANYIINPLLILQKQKFQNNHKCSWYSWHLISSTDLYNSLKLLTVIIWLQDIT